MSKGRIACIGSYQDCVEASEVGPSLASPTSDSPKGDEELISSTDAVVEDIATVDTNDPTTPQESSSIASKEKQDSEVSTSGVVKMKTFKNYVQAMPGGLPVGLLLLLVFCLTQGSALACIAFIGKWSNLPVDKQRSVFIIASVFGLVIAVGSLALVRAIMYFHLTIEASKRLHDDMTKSVIRAKIEFFDTNSLGRVLNRFSADVGIADDQLPVALFDFSCILFMTIGALVSAFSILPLTAVFLPPLVWYFLRVRGVFLRTSRELKRIEGKVVLGCFVSLLPSVGASF
jgi:ATP-binding cassette subfamily C (CFTR/MRP) protein 4